MFCVVSVVNWSGAVAPTSLAQLPDDSPVGKVSWRAGDGGSEKSIPFSNLRNSKQGCGFRQLSPSPLSVSLAIVVPRPPASVTVELRRRPADDEGGAGETTPRLYIERDGRVAVEGAAAQPDALPLRALILLRSQGRRGLC